MARVGRRATGVRWNSLVVKWTGGSHNPDRRVLRGNIHGVYCHRRRRHGRGCDPARPCERATTCSPCVGQRVGDSRRAMAGVGRTHPSRARPAQCSTGCLDPGYFRVIRVRSDSVLACTAQVHRPTLPRHAHLPPALTAAPRVLLAGRSFDLQLRPRGCRADEEGVTVVALHRVLVDPAGAERARRRVRPRRLLAVRAERGWAEDGEQLGVQPFGRTLGASAEPALHLVHASMVGRSPPCGTSSQGAFRPLE